jgi:hypothetical protein
MGNILISNNPALNTPSFVKFLLRISQNSRGNLIVYDPVPKLPVLEPVPAGDIAGMDEDFFSGNDSLTDKLSRYDLQENLLTIQTDFDFDKIAGTIIANDIELIIMSKEDALEAGRSLAETMKFINKLTCPLFLVDNENFKYPDKISYVTDLRYCTIEVVRYLKLFAGSIYVTHVTASGLTDIEDRYSQELLASFSAKLNYNKIFLRNIKGKVKEKTLELITREIEINCIAIESRKHIPLENFLTRESADLRNYHSLPLLILPYLNWGN